MVEVTWGRLGSVVAVALGLVGSVQADPSCPGGVPRLDLASGSAAVGVTVTLAVDLTSNGAPVGATANDLSYDPQLLSFARVQAGARTTERNGTCHGREVRAGLARVGCLTSDGDHVAIPYADGRVALLTFSVERCPESGRIVIANRASGATVPPAIGPVEGMCGRDGMITCVVTTTTTTSSTTTTTTSSSTTSTTISTTTTTTSSTTTTSTTTTGAPTTTTTTTTVPTTTSSSTTTSTTTTVVPTTTTTTQLPTTTTTMPPTTSTSTTTTNTTPSTTTAPPTTTTTSTSTSTTALQTTSTTTTTTVPTTTTTQPTTTTTSSTATSTTSTTAPPTTTTTGTTSTTTTVPITTTTTLPPTTSTTTVPTTTTTQPTTITSTTTTTTTHPITCGNHVLDSGEQCDDGNLVNGDCCSTTCQFESAGSACGDSSDTECTDPDTCDVAGSCQANHVDPGAPCGDQGVECYVDDSCDGSGGCTDNGFEPAGAACGDPTDTECTDPDSCDGAGICQANHTPSGTGCDDGDACTPGQEICSAGVCVAADKMCEINVFPGSCTPRGQCSSVVVCTAIGDQGGKKRGICRVRGRDLSDRKVVTPKVRRRLKGAEGRVSLPLTLNRRGRKRLRKHDKMDVEVTVRLKDRLGRKTESVQNITLKR